MSGSRKCLNIMARNWKTNDTGTENETESVVKVITAVAAARSMGRCRVRGAVWRGVARLAGASGHRVTIVTHELV